MARSATNGDVHKYVEATAMMYKTPLGEDVNFVAAHMDYPVLTFFRLRELENFAKRLAELPPKRKWNGRL